MSCRGEDALRATAGQTPNCQELCQVAEFQVPDAALNGLTALGTPETEAVG